MNPIASAGTFIAAWILIILSLSVLANTTWGKPLVAYVLWLMVFLVVVTHWPSVTELLSPQATGLPEPATQFVGLPTEQIPVHSGY